MSFRVLEHVVDGPESETERVVIDVQVDEVVALDVGVGLSVETHVVDGVLDIIARVGLTEKFVGGRLGKEAAEGFHRRREALLGHAEPQVVEVLMEHLEVLIDLLCTERARRKKNLKTMSYSGHPSAYLLGGHRKGFLEALFTSIEGPCLWAMGGESGAEAKL